MTRQSRWSRNAFLIGLTIGAAAYHLSLTRPWARGSGHLR